MNRGLRRRLLGASPQRDRILADRALGRRAAEDAALRAADAHRLATAMERLARVPHVTLGTTEEGTPFRVPLTAIDGAHFHGTGATGSGKSMIFAALIDQLIAHLLRGEPVAIIVLALQGFLSDMVLGAVARRLQGASPAVREAVLSRLTVLRFHRGDFLTPWQLIAPEPGLPIVAQAAAYGEVTEQTLGTRIGAKQEASLTNLLSLAMCETPPLTLLELRTLLHAPKLLAARAERVALPEVRLYFRERFLRESQASLDGLRSRLDLLLRDDALRATLAGPERLDLSECFRPGAITLFDFGGAPLAFEGSRALAGLALQALAFQVFNPRRSREAFTLIVGDELQQALSPAGVRVVDALLTTARAHRVGLATVHQALRQLPRELAELYAVNARYRLLFRPSHEELREQSDLVPVGEDTSREAVAERWRRLGNLPTGQYVFTERGGEWGPRVLTAPRFAPSPLHALPAELRRAVERGGRGVPRSELLRRAEAQEARAFAEVEGARVPETPDLTERRRRRP